MENAADSLAQGSDAMSWWVALLVYLLGALMDWKSTKRGLRRGAKELNPVAKWLIRVLGVDWAATILKLGVLALLVYWAAWWPIFILGCLQVVAAVGNEEGWWAKLLHKWKTRKSRLPK